MSYAESMSVHLFVTSYHSVAYILGQILWLESKKLTDTYTYSVVLFYAQLEINSPFAVSICQTEVYLILFCKRTKKKVEISVFFTFCAFRNHLGIRTLCGDIS